jgi:hypothetical protein
MKFVLRPDACNLFGPALKWARLQARPRISQDDLAARVTLLGRPMDRTIVSRIENQRRALSDIEFMLIVQALRVDPVKLFRFAFRHGAALASYAEITAGEDEFQLRVAEHKPDLPESG